MYRFYLHETRPLIRSSKYMLPVSRTLRFTLDPLRRAQLLECSASGSLSVRRRCTNLKFGRLYRTHLIFRELRRLVLQRRNTGPI